MAKENGTTEYQLNVADNRTDPRDYGMKELGWKRVAGNNIQTWTLTRDDLHSISNGIDEILGEMLDDSDDDSPDVEYNIEVGATGKLYTNVPISVIENLNPAALREYELGYAYAKNKGHKMNWYILAKKKKRKKTYNTMIQQELEGNTPNQIDTINSIRKEMPPPTRIHTSPKGKKGYDRKNKGWQKEI